MTAVAECEVTVASGDKQPTRGGDLLSRCADSHSEIAAKVGVDKSLVTRWVSGARKPSDDAMGKLEGFYGIPRGAWTEAPTPKAETGPKAEAVAVSRDTGTGGGSCEPRPTEQPGREVDPDEDPNDQLYRYIQQGIEELRADAGLSGVKKAESIKKLVDAKIALDKSTGENALTLQRIVAHAEFKRVVRLITDAVAPFPEALAAVTTALKGVQA